MMRASASGTDPGARQQPPAICGHSLLAGGRLNIWQLVPIGECRLCKSMLPLVMPLLHGAQWIDANMPLGGNAVRTGDTTFKGFIAPHARFMASRSGAKVC